MKTHILPAFLFAASALAVGVGAQTTQVAHPTTPAPVVSLDSPAPSRVIYTPRLPSTTELSDVAVAQGLSIQRIDQTDSQITVVYKNAAGSITTVGYRILGNTAAPAPATVVVTRPAPTVVYTQPDPFYYYDEPYYRPWSYGYYSPVSVSLGFGWYGGGYHGGHYGGRGGFRGHRRW